MHDYYYQELSASQRNMYHSLTEAIAKRKESFFADSDDAEEISRVFECVSYDRPELFFVDLFNVRMTILSPGRSRVEIRYFYTPEETRRRIDAVEASIRQFLAGSSTKASQLERVRLIHDRLVRSVVYDDHAAVQRLNVPDALTVEGVFLRHSAVCDGITKAVVLLGERLGLSLPAVRGEASNDGIHYLPHSWNMACIDGSCAHMDVTWDISLSTQLRFTRYDYFCLPDVDMRLDHVFGGLPPCFHGKGLSFFEKSCREFFDLDTCRHYISDRLRERSDVIYFKFVEHSTPPEITAKKMDDAVANYLRLHSLFMFDLEKNHNLAQGVYFYRVKKRL